MGQEFEAVVFDMDGVIFDSERAVMECWMALADKYGIPDLKRHYYDCIGVNTAKSREIMKAAYGEEFPYDTYAKEASEMFHAKYADNRLPMKPGVRELLDFLKVRKKKIALASSTRRETVLKQIQAAGILEYFDAVVCGDMVARSKPAPDIFLKACEEIGVKPGEAYAIEDSYNGIKAAHAGGLHPIMVPDLLPANEEMEKLAEVILKNLLEVRGYCEERERKMSEKVTLSGVPETMLQTVYARAKESKGRKAIEDKKAEEIIDRLDYDFSLADKDAAMHSGVIARTIVLDKLVKEYLSAHPGAVMVNIACGLDTRCYRMSGYSHWYNLDLPETIAVREKLLPEEGAISQIAMSAMEDWSGQIKETKTSALVIIEGLTMYLSEEAVKKIFSVISGCFSQVEVLVEVMNPMMAKHFKEKSIEGSKAKFTWGVKKGRDLAALLPDFYFVEEHSLVEGMAVFVPVYKLLGKIPAIRNISNRIVILKKGNV